jgi:hypothetical protein
MPCPENTTEKFTNKLIKSMEDIEAFYFDRHLLSEFSLICWNVRSLRTMDKFNKLKFLLSNLVGKSNSRVAVDCIVITESWIEENRFNLYNLRNYNSMHLTRPAGNRGGGVSIFVKKQYAMNEIFKLNDGDIEVLIIEMIGDEGIKTIAGIYRPPGGNIDRFLEYLEDIMTQFPQLIMTGDFNINMMDPHSSKLTDLMHNYDYDLLNSLVTRNDSGSIIDHIWMQSAINRDVDVVTSGKQLISDHNLLMLIIKSRIRRKAWTKTVKQVPNINRVISKLRENPSLIEAGNLRDVNALFTEVIEGIGQKIEDTKREITIKHKYEDEIPSWADAKFAGLMNHIKNVFDKMESMKAKGLPFNLLKQIYEEAQKELKEYSHQKAVNHFTTTIKNNGKMSWKIINEMTGRSKQKQEKWLLNIDNNLVTDKKSIVNAFGTHFAGIVGSAPESRIPVTYYAPSTTLETMALFCVDDIKVARIIDQLSTAKATGCDNIPVRIWKEIKDKHIESITLMINSVLSSQVYPDILKVARIKPIFKAKDRLDVGNYRAISVQTAFNKIQERVIYTQMEKFLTKHNLFDEHQYGYRKGRGRQEAICKLMSHASSAIDKSKHVAILFFDLSKAFDSVSHQLLLSKIAKMGFRGPINDLLRSYLANRSQFVLLEEARSDTVAVNRGVPQGSTLGPLLFIMLLYDMSFLNTVSLLIKFADDLGAVCVGDSEAELKDSMERDLNTISKYYNENGLELNLSKSKYMICSSRTNTVEIHSMMARLGIESVASYKYLGVAIDKHLSMNDHCNNLCSTVTQTVRATSILRNYLPQDCLMQFFQANFMSHIRACAFLLSRVDQKDIKRLQTLQNRGLKMIFRLDCRHSSLDLHTNYADRILPIVGTIFFSQLVMVWKSLNAGDGYLLQFEQMNRGTRQDGSLRIEKFRRGCFEFDVKIYGAQLFNQLDLRIRSSSKIEEFKREVFRLLSGKVDILLRENQIKQRNLV